MYSQQYGLVPFNPMDYYATQAQQYIRPEALQQQQLMQQPQQLMVQPNNVGNNLGIQKQEQPAYLGYAKTFSDIAQGTTGLINAGIGIGNYNLAKKQFEYQKEFGLRNLNNSVQAYNTALEDRYRSRYSNPDQAAVDSYVAKNSLKGI